MGAGQVLKSDWDAEESGLLVQGEERWGRSLPELLTDAAPKVQGDILLPEAQAGKSCVLAVFVPVQAPCTQQSLRTKAQVSHLLLSGC